MNIIYKFDGDSTEAERLTVYEYLNKKFKYLLALNSFQISGVNIPPTVLAVMSIQTEAFIDGYRVGCLTQE